MSQMENSDTVERVDYVSGAPVFARVTEDRAYGGRYVLLGLSVRGGASITAVLTVSQVESLQELLQRTVVSLRDTDQRGTENTPL